MSDSYTSVTSQSWLSRLLGSIVGVFIGVLMIVAAVVLLFWNEGRTVRTAKGLKTGGAEVISVPVDRVDAANDGHLVYTTGDATTSEVLADPDFGVAVPAIRLARHIEIFQWKEDSQSQTRNKFGGGTETVTTYTYATVWSPSLIDSSHFHEGAGHQNPTSMPIVAGSWTAKTVALGSFTLAAAQIDKMTHTEPVRVVDTNSAQPAPAGVRLHQGAYYRGADPASPVVGDERITFEAVPPATISVIARQVGHSFEADRSTGTPILLLTYGTVSPDAMFTAAESQNRILAWVLRGLGFVATLIGFVLIFRPLVAVADVVPLLGSLLGAGTFLVSLVLAVSVSLVTIGVAWVAYRPVVGALLLAGAVASLIALERTSAARKPAAAART